MRRCDFSPNSYSDEKKGKGRQQGGLQTSGGGRGNWLQHLISPRSERQSEANGVNAASIDCRWPPYATEPKTPECSEGMSDAVVTMLLVKMMGHERADESRRKPATPVNGLRSGLDCRLGSRGLTCRHASTPVGLN